MRKVILILLISLIYSNSYIIIPFQELENDDIYDFKNVEELLDELSYLKLYSEFYMGIYPKKLPVFFKKDIDFFYLGENKVDKLISKDNFNPSTAKDFKFDFKNKKYYTLLGTFNFLMAEGELKTIYKDDKGQIDANNYLTFENIKLLHQVPDSSINNYAGYMGFSYPNSNYNDTNFITILKEKALITNTVWSVYFPDIDEDTCKKGYIVIGEFPHIYKPELFKKEEFFKMKIPQCYNNDTENAWKINVDSVSILKKYYENTDKKELGLSCDYIKSISLEFGSYMMYAPKRLFEQLKEHYFDYFFDNGICDYKKIKTEEDKLIIVYCDKKLFEVKDQMYFPSIYIDIQELGGTFELSYKEVFMTQNDKVYFMIAFSSKEIESNIKLGQIFLYKYQFTFDYENREIGVYKNNIDSQKVIHRIKRAFRGKELLIYTILVLIVIGLFFCYKKGYIGKKKTIDYKTANKNIANFSGDGIEDGYELKNDD